MTEAWLVPFEELQMGKEIGRGAYGRVYKARVWCFFLSLFLLFFFFFFFFFARVTGLQPPDQTTSKVVVISPIQVARAINPAAGPWSESFHSPPPQGKPTNALFSVCFCAAGHTADPSLQPEAAGKIHVTRAGTVAVLHVTMAEQSTAEKLEILRAARERWLLEREAEAERRRLTDRASTSEPIGVDPDIPDQTLSRSPPPLGDDGQTAVASARETAASAALLDEMTARIVRRLKDELRDGGQAVGAGLPSMSEDRLRTYVEDSLLANIEQRCAICYDVMVPPNRIPIILSPCGHTFCKVGGGGGGCGWRMWI